MISSIQNQMVAERTNGGGGAERSHIKKKTHKGERQVKKLQKKNEKKDYEGPRASFHRPWEREKKSTKRGTSTRQSGRSGVTQGGKKKQKSPALWGGALYWRDY